MASTTSGPSTTTSTRATSLRWRPASGTTRCTQIARPIHSDQIVAAVRETNTIARVWRGVVPIEKAEAYLRYLVDFGFRDYQTSSGNRAVHLLRRTEAARVHFLLLSFWSSRQAIMAYAGTDIEQAHYYPCDLECLIDPPSHVEHYEVLPRIVPAGS